MKQLLLLSILLHLFLGKSNAQNGDKMLTRYVNYLASHTNLSYDSIHHLEQDSAYKMIMARFGNDSNRYVIRAPHDTIYHWDSATVVFLNKRRLAIPSKK